MSSGSTASTPSDVLVVRQVDDDFVGSRSRPGMIGELENVNENQWRR
jgi:hypothetical protein